nr:PKD domain-containing protein [uncultured Methanoregula sp.]
MLLGVNPAGATGTFDNETIVTDRAGSTEVAADTTEPPAEPTDIAQPEAEMIATVPVTGVSTASVVTETPCEIAVDRAGFVNIAADATVLPTEPTPTRQRDQDVLSTYEKRLMSESTASQEITGKTGNVLLPVIYVDGSNGSDSNDGSILSPKKTIGAGLSAVDVEGTVFVASGLYKEHLMINRKVFTIIGTSPSDVIISGNDTGRVVTISPNARVILKNLSIVHGRSPYGPDTEMQFVADDGGNGGGILNYGAPLTLDNCIVSDNHASDGGSNTNTTSFDLVRSGNGGNGGGIFSVGPLFIYNSTIRKNTAGNAGFTLIGTGGEGGSGGGIYVISHEPVRIINSTIKENSAGDGGAIVSMGLRSGNGGSGGGIYFSAGKLFITGGNIRDNRAGNATYAHYGLCGTGGSGGGIAAIQSYLVVNGSTVITGNYAGHGGDGYQQLGGPGGSGGGIFADGSHIYLHQTDMVEYNFAGDGGSSDFFPGGNGGNGGGIYSFGEMSMWNGTLTGNRAGIGGKSRFNKTNSISGDGGGIFGYDVAGSVNQVRFAENQPNALTSANLNMTFQAVQNYWGTNDDPRASITGNVNYVPWRLNLVPVFSADNRSGTAPQTVQFTDITTGNPTSWSWDFGDGTNSTEQNPRHTYTRSQTYRVNLTVSDGTYKNTTSRKDFITTMAWKKVFGGSDNDFGKVSLQTHDEGVLIIGETQSHDGDIPPKQFPDGQEIVLAKNSLDSNYPKGILEWKKVYGGSKEDEAEYALELDDGYLIIGSTSSNDGNVSGNHGGDFGTSDVWIFKLDLGGNLVWQKCYGGTHDEKGLAAVKNVTASGNVDSYVITGWTESNDGDVSGNHNPDTRDIWIFAINASGDHEILWQQCYGGSSDDEGRYIEESNDGKSWIIAGSTKSTDGDLTGKKRSSDSKNVWIFSIPRVGQTHPVSSAFNRVFGGSADDVALAIQTAPSSEGGYLAAGYTSSNDGNVSRHYGSKGSRDMWVLKIADDGKLQWEKTFGGSKDDIGAAIRVWPSRNAYYIIGYTASNDYDALGINHGGDSGTTDMFYVKLSYNGNLLSSHCYGGSLEDYAVRFGDRSGNNHAYVIGNTFSNDGDVNGMNHGGSDIALFQLL